MNKQSTYNTANTTSYFLAFITLFFLLAISINASANNQFSDGQTIALEDVHNGSLLFKSDLDNQYLLAPRIKTDVLMKINGLISRVTVRQSFKNTSTEWVEGIYVFPLPENSAVDRMKMIIGERVIEGKIMERSAAKHSYEKAKKQGKKTALIEQERANLFTNSVANIGPGEEVHIEIEYQQILRYDNGTFSVRLPLTITPRYIPGSSIMADERINTFNDTGWSPNPMQVSDAKRITPPVIEKKYKTNRVDIRVELDAGFPLQKITSRYHAVNQQFIDDGQYLISLAEGEIPADRDFELVWSPQPSHTPRAALFTELQADYDYHLVMVLPPSDGTVGTQSMQREVIFIIDTSGSMQGESIEQAKRALNIALDRLRQHDQFNIIEFNSNYSKIFSEPQPATHENILKAKRIIGYLNADGGTEIYPALQAALDNQAGQTNEYLRQVVFLTDGSVGNESELFSLIKKKLGNSRLFTIGIGSAPNSHFMSKAAEFGRGSFTYIGDVNEVQEKMQALFSKLESPIMTNLDIEFPQDNNVISYPDRIPDLYIGEPIMLAARSDKYSRESLSITGQRAHQPWRIELPLADGRQSSGIAVLWARNKISYLLDSVYEGKDKQQVKQAVIETALKHHIVSKYTSLIAVDVTPSRPSREDLNSKSVPNNLPQGTEQQMQVMQLARTATNSRFHVLSGALILVLALLLYGYIKVNRVHTYQT